jgi:hypothetical protein
MRIARELTKPSVFKGIKLFRLASRDRLLYQNDIPSSLARRLPAAGLSLCPQSQFSKRLEQTTT